MKLPDDFDIDSLPIIGDGAAQTPQAQAAPSATGQSQQQQSAGFDLDSLPELPRIPTAEEKRAQFEEWKRRRDAAQAAEPEEIRPGARGFLGDVARGMFTTEGVREAAEENWTAKPYAYMNDIANSIVSGFLGGGAKIEEAAGRIVGDNAVGRALVNDAQAGQAKIEQALPTNALDTSGGGVVNKVLDVGKGVAHVTGEFAPAAIPGIGQAYAATTVSAGSVNRYGQVKEAAKASGYSDAQAEAWATGAGALDALQNILLMKGFRGIWGGGQKAAADAAKQSLVKKLMVDTVKTGGIMSGGGMAQDVVNQNVGIDQQGLPSDVRPYDWTRTAKVGVDQFLEGGMFHLVNTAAHAMPKALAWESAPRTMSAKLAREALDTPEGRALVMSNNPEAAKKILEARKNGKDVSRRMLEELGIPSEVAPSKGDRNALADSVAEDYRAWKDWQKTLPDKQQSAALDAEIAGVGAEGDAAATIRQRVLEEVNRPRPPEKDGEEPRPAEGPDALNDPKRRAELVMDAAREIVGDKGDIGRQIEAGKKVEARAQNEAAREAKRTAKAEEAADAARAEQERLQAEAEQEVAIKERAEQEARPNAAVGEMKAAEVEARKQEANPHQARLDAWPEYAAFLAKNHMKNTAKNWNKFVMRNNLDPNMKVETPDQAKKRGAKEFERGLAPDEELVAFDEYSKYVQGEEYQSGKSNISFDEWLAQRREGAKNGPTTAPRDKGTTTPPNGAEPPQGAETGENRNTPRPLPPPNTAQAVKEPPPEPKKPFGKGDSSHGQGKYSRDNYDKSKDSSGATGAATWHWQNGGRVYNLPVDFELTRPGGPVVLKATDSATERLKQVLNGYKLKMNKTGKIEFEGTFKGTVPTELRELLGRELKIGDNPDAPSKDDLYSVNKGQFGDETRTTWGEVEEAVAEDRENYHNWQKRQQRADRRASEEKKLEKKVKSGKATQNELDILRHRNMMEDYLDQGGKETDADYKAMERDLEVLQESGTYDYEGLSKAKDAADRFRDAEWENAIGDIESGEGDFSPSDQYVKPFTRENLQGAKKGDIIHFDHDEVKYELDRYDPETGVMDVYRSDENGVKRRFKVSRNGVEEIRNDGKGQKGVVQDNAGDAGGGGRPAPGAAGGEARGAEGAAGRGSGAGGAESRKPADLTLESLTPEQQRAELERIAEQQQTAAQKAEMEERRTATLKGGTGDLGQQTLDLGGAEGEQDLFNRREARQEEALSRRLQDQKFKDWAKKHGVTPTKDHLEMYDREQAKGAFAVAKRWIRGIKAKFESRPPTDADLGANDRAMVVTDPAEIAELEKDPVSRLRSMQLQNGKLYPPMAGKVKQPGARKAEWVNPTELGSWQRADERPDLAFLDKKTGNWKFKLDKGNGESVVALYNPYWHTTSSPLNDQFSSAYKRPELVTVETLVPRAEAEGRTGYKAEKAADVEGEKSWHSGTVSAQLKEAGLPERTVTLSRHNKVVRIVPTAEVADRITAQIREAASKGVQVEIPFNTLTPQLRDALYARGVKIGEVRGLSGGALAAANRAYNKWKSDIANIRYLRNVRGDIIGKWDKATGEVTFYPGANAETVAHEIGWHATYDHAEKLAAQGDRRLLDKLNAYARGAQQATWTKTLTRYGMASDPRIIIDEVGAARFTAEQAMKIKNETDRRAALKWYGKAWEACRDAYKSMLTKMGFNKTSVDALNGMSPERAVEFMATEMARGKTLAKVEAKKVPGVNDALTAKEKYVRAAKDSMHVLKWVDEVTGGRFHLHRDQKLSHGMKQKAFDRAMQFWNEMATECKAAGIKLTELDEYIRAKGAADTNRRIKALNGNENGAGISDVDAARTVLQYERGAKGAAMKRIAQKLWDLQHEGLMERVNAGLVDAQFAADLEANEPFHVPRHNRFDANGEFTGYEMNAQLAANEWHKAEGRTTDSANAVGWIMQEYCDAFSRGAENRVRQRLAQALLASNGVLGNATVVTPANEARLAEKTKANKNGNAQVVIVKQGGKKVALELNGVRGEAVARALTGRNVKEMPSWVKKTLRIWASTATEWSPTFALRNLTADLADVMLLNIGDHGIVKGLKRDAGHIKAMATLARDIRQYVKTGKTNNALLNEAIGAGILIGGMGREGFTDPNEAHAFFQDRMQLYGEEGLKRAARRGIMGAKNVAKSLFGWVETINKTTELMNRLADYKKSRDMGMSPRDAAAHARDITVDFNEKGEWTGVSNALYMFSNSTMGAAFRQVKGVTGKHWKSIVGTALAIGFAEGLMEAMNGDEDDADKAGTGTGNDMNEYTRANSLYLRFGNTTVRTPFHAGPLSVIKYTGNCAARYMAGLLNDKNKSAIKGSEAAANIGKEASGLITHFLGLGDAGPNVMQTITPSVLQWLVQLGQNRDYADRPIAKPKFDEAMPSSENGRRSTAEGYKDIARLLNEWSGGNAGRKGSVDYAPEQYKVVAEAVGKNVLRDVTSAAQTVGYVIDLFRGNADIDTRNIPVVRDFVRVNHSGNTQRYYEAATGYREDRYELQKMVAQWTPEERKAYVQAHPWARNPEVNKAIQKIGELQKYEDGFVKNGRGWVKRKEPPTEEQKAKWKAARLRYQARFLEYAEKHGGVH